MRTDRHSFVAGGTAEVESHWALDNASSVADILRWRADRQRDRVVFTFLANGEHDAETLTYGDLDTRARTLAAHLLEEGDAGDRALLLYPPGVDFLVGFFGCLYAGLIPVPLYPPRINRRDARCLQVAQDAGARFALTTSRVVATRDRIERHSPEFIGLCWLATDALSAGSISTPGARVLNPDAVAYLQYTSGSTRVPKGVMVTHRNVLANLEDIHRGLPFDERSILVSWLPHFHDMGLVGNLLPPIVFGFPCYFMPPAAFLQRPVRWLRAVSRLGATHSGGPNFAYRLCVDRISSADAESLDLTRWSVAFNGAEPIRRETIENFCEKFGACGFERSAFSGSYGLAEATLKVTTQRLGQGPAYFHASADALERGDVQEAVSEADARVLVGCGAPEPGTKILIVNPDSLEPCAPDVVGEIWVASPSVAKGYWNRPDESRVTFRASPSGDNTTTVFLRTGDLGFLRGGQLFVTGRRKDLIIIRGRNHYPQDIELTVQRADDTLIPDAGAAVSIDARGEERLLVIQEWEQHGGSSAEDAVRRIRDAILEHHEIAPCAIVLVRHNSIPRTSSGKVQRHACASAFVEGHLRVVSEWRES